MSDSPSAVVYNRAIRQIPAERARTGLRAGSRNCVVPSGIRFCAIISSADLIL